MRDRRQRGYRCAIVEVGSRDVSALTQAGLLDEHRAEDLSAIEAAIGAVLDQLADRHW